MRKKTCETKKIACIECIEHQIFCQMEFLPRTFGDHHYHAKRNYRKTQPDNPADDEYLRQVRRKLEEQVYQIDNPHIIEYAVIQDTLEIGQEIQEREILVRQQDIAVLPDTEAYQRLRPAQALVEQPVPFYRHIRHADGVFGKADPIARFADFLGDVAVQSRSDVPTAHFPERLHIESAESARYDMVDSQPVVTIRPT